MSTVLAVDDSETMRRLVEVTLKSGHFDVCLAEDGVDGLEKYSGAGNVDLVIADLHLPRMGGVEFIREIKERNPHMPVIVLTSDVGGDVREQCVAAGADGWLTKPIKPSHFLEVVRRLVNHDN